MTDQSPSYHYATIARALREIDQAGPGLTLETLAARIGLSPAHFQRLFSQWVGVSPKRYLQYLALDHARDLLAQRFTTLATAHETGLSSPGRLHDLFVTWEAMTPGTYAKGGAGLTIRWGLAPSPFGETVVMATPRGIFELKYFFTTAIASAETDGDAHSAEAVRHRIRALIDAEAPAKVLSDDALVDILKAEGIDIARRTVAKYRESLGIPSSVQRRREARVQAAR